MKKSKVNIEEATIKASIMASLDVMGIRYKSVDVKADKEGVDIVIE